MQKKLHFCAEEQMSRKKIGALPRKLKYKILAGVCDKFSIKLHDDVYFVKFNRGSWDDDTLELNDIAEVFSNYFLNSLGVENVQYKLASIGGKDVVVSKSFISKDVKYERTFSDMVTLYLFQKKYGNKYDVSTFFEKKQIDLCMNELRKIVKEGENPNSVEFILDVVQKVCETNEIEFDKSQLKHDLCKQVLVDYFMSNFDRHANNVTFLFKENGGKLKCELAPLFDHGYAFGIADYPMSLYYVSQVGISKESQKKSIDTFFHKPLQSGDLFLSELINAVSEDDSLQMLAKGCREMNIDRLIEKFEGEEQEEIPVSHKERIKSTFEKRCEDWDRVSNLLKENGKDYVKETMNKEEDYEFLW